MSNTIADERLKQDLFSTTKDKMKVQQRMIDLTARELQSTRLSSQAIAERSSPGNALEENILLVENKLMKLFARQLMHKHMCLNELSRETNYNFEKTNNELDQLISFQMFLAVAGLQERATKALLQEESISVDKLFQFSPQELQQMFQKLDICSSDCHKLVSLLDLMSHYYDKWMKGEKPTAGPYDMRRNSSSGRLNSLTSLDSRKNSSSSHTISPPAGNLSSRSSTPVTPVTPSSVLPFIGLPHQSSVPTMTVHMTNENEPFKRSNSSGGSTYINLIEVAGQNLSSSSSSLNSDQSNTQQSNHHTDGLLPPPSTVTPPSTSSSNNSSSNIKAKRKLGHTRSHSNPPLANLIMPEVVPENSVPDYRSPSPPYYNSNSNAPPARTGSQSSIAQNNVGSPSTKSHPQVRRIMANNFVKSVSTDLGDHTLSHPPPPVRSNSEASGVQSSSPRQRRLSKETGTSASMVDLPMIRCSTDKLDQSEYTFSQPGKSHSVPRLVNLVVNPPTENNSQLQHSVSVPTSPRLPSNYNPTGVIGHKIDHRFVAHIFLGVQECDYCKKTLVMNSYKCRYCKYKCHRNCSKVAPSNCGLSRDFLDYARQYLMSPSSENIYQVNSLNVPPATSPPKTSLSNSSEYQLSTTLVPSSLDSKSDDSPFIIQDLNKEPTNSQYSPVIQSRRYLPPPSPIHENSRSFNYQTTSRLEVPSRLHPSPLHTHHHHPQSTSSSPSTSSQSSPCLTPVSPNSPIGQIPDYSVQFVRYHPVPPVILTDDSEPDEDEYRDSYEDGFDFAQPSYQKRSRGLHPPSQVISAQSLPNLLLSEQNGEHSDTGGMYTTSEDNLQSFSRKQSVTGTISTADSKTSTLVGSIMEEDDTSDSELYGSQGAVDEDTNRASLGHRNSMIDEWIVPYDDVRLIEKLGSGPVAEVHKAYWHGEVAIKKFVLPNATSKQLQKFKEEVAVLKKTRHENLALFMGVCLTPPNLAIITSYCRGYTLYKLLHYWSEVFSLERLVNVGRQIAQAMGYLHARGIVHKGLNSKNIFLEKTTDQKEKVVITDMGLSALSSLLSPDSSKGTNEALYIPRTQIYYMAPEIIKLISPYSKLYLDQEIYPYSNATDIYSFGTILYELINRRFPFAADNFGFAYEMEVAVFLIGSGRRQQFKNTDVPKQLKDIVWECWSYDPQSRPSFSGLKERLARLCRKHTPITRSPSHPINLSKSVDNLLFI